MALSTTKAGINRTASNIVLPQTVASEVLSNVQEGSAVMQLARRQTIPGTGVKINVITGDPEPDWVAESTEKPVSQPTFSNLTMTPYKLAVIVPFSDEFRRDMDALYEAVVERVPGALASKFDKAVLFGAAPGANFSTLANVDAVDIQSNTYKSLVTAKTGISTAGGYASGWVFAPQAEAILLNATDTAGRPIFIDSAADDGRVGRVLATPAYYRQAAYKAGSSAANTLGFVGDWSQAIYGVVNDVKVDYTDQATINDGTNLIHLFQRNMFALRCEMEVGFVTRSGSYFKRLTDTYTAPTGGQG